MPSKGINQFKSFSDIELFLNKTITRIGESKEPVFLDGAPKIGRLGGRKFINAKGQEFSMNQIVKKLVEVTEKTVKDVKDPEELKDQMKILKKVIKDLKDLDTLGYEFSRDKDTISLFQRIMTTIRQGFGISEKVRKDLYKDIEELQNKKLPDAVRRPSIGSEEEAVEAEQEIELTIKPKHSPEEKLAIGNKLKQIFSEGDYYDLIKNEDFKLLDSNLNKLVKYLADHKSDNFSIKKGFEKEFFGVLKDKQFEPRHFEMAIAGKSLTILRIKQEPPDLSASNPLSDSYIPK